MGGGGCQPARVLGGGVGGDALFAESGELGALGFGETFTLEELLELLGRACLEELVNHAVGHRASQPTITHQLIDEIVVRAIAHGATAGHGHQPD